MEPAATSFPISLVCALRRTDSRSLSGFDMENGGIPCEGVAVSICPPYSVADVDFSATPMDSLQGPFDGNFIGSFESKVEGLNLPYSSLRSLNGVSVTLRSDDARFFSRSDALPGGRLTIELVLEDGTILELYDTPALGADEWMRPDVGATSGQAVFVSQSIGTQGGVRRALFSHRLARLGRLLGWNLKL